MKVKNNIAAKLLYYTVVFQNYIQLLSIVLTAEQNAKYQRLLYTFIKSK